MTLQKVPVTKRYLDFQKFLNHIDSLGQVNPDEKNYELIHWLEKLPAMIDKIQSSTIIHDIWLKYVSLVEKNVDYYSLLCSQSFSIIRNLFEIAEVNMPKLIIIPNYLQAAEAIDLVIIEDEIYIITANSDKESIVHELLHYVLDKELIYCEDLIKDNIALIEPVGQTFMITKLRQEIIPSYMKLEWIKQF